MCIHDQKNRTFLFYHQGCVSFASRPACVGPLRDATSVVPRDMEHDSAEAKASCRPDSGPCALCHHPRPMSFPPGLSWEDMEPRGSSGSPPLHRLCHRRSLGTCTGVLPLDWVGDSHHALMRISELPGPVECLCLGKPSSAKLVWHHITARFVMSQTWQT